MMEITEFFDFLENAPDTRQDWKIKHKMGDIIAVTVIGMLAGHNDLKAVHLWATLNIAPLLKYLELPNGIPSYDCIRRTLATISDHYLNTLLQKCNELLAANNRERICKLLAIDGKTQCGNGTSRQKANHIVSAIDENGICYGQEKVEEKSNEITAIPKLLEALGLKGKIVTIDAMGTQKDIAAKIRKGKGDYVLGLKGNHGTLKQDVEDYFQDHDLLKKCAYTRKVEKARGGIEVREYWQSTDVSWLEQLPEWTGLKSIVMTRNTVTKEEKTTEETRYFISSLGENIELAAKAIRGHWAVESFHWHLDFTFREDDCLILEKQCALNMNILRKLVMTLLKSTEIGDKRTSMKNKRIYVQCMPVEYLEKIFGV
jgi:predicted transposase YbfD/YdcC